MLTPTQFIQGLIDKYELAQVQSLYVAYGATEEMFSQALNGDKASLFFVSSLSAKVFAELKRLYPSKSGRPSAPLGPQECRQLFDLVQEQGALVTRQRIGISELALGKALSGLPVARETATLIQLVLS